MATFHSAFIGPEAAEISPETVSQIPYASMYAKMGDNPQALLILGWADSSSYATPRFKWLSADKEMIVTEGGRIIKTVALKNGNLVRAYSDSPDPLMLGLLSSTTPKKWNFTLDWQPGYHIGYKASSVFNVGKPEMVSLPNQKRSLIHVTERVEISSLSVSYNNEYWLDPTHGQVVASEQYLFPGSEKVKLSVAKPYVSGAN